MKGSMKHQSVVLILLVTVIAVTASCRQKAPLVKSDVAPTACVVALVPATQQNETDRDIAQLQEQARREPNPKLGLEQLGYRYVARARVATIRVSTSSPRRPPNASSRHLRRCLRALAARPCAASAPSFHEAEQIARRLTVKREFVLDYGLLGDVLMEQGRLTEAAEAYQKMIDSSRSISRIPGPPISAG